MAVHREPAALLPGEGRARGLVGTELHGNDHAALAHLGYMRMIGNVVYFMPPYVITPGQIDLMVEVAREGIERATCD